MAVKFSTGLKNFILGDASLKDAMDDGLIKIYSGTVPADADAALGSAVLLNTYTDNGAAVGAGNGVDLDTAAASGAISKAPAQVWKGTAVATNTATFFRWIQQADTGVSSTTEKRMQGTCGGAGADMFMASTSIVSGTDYTIDYFSTAIPDL